jgi:ferric-dicitrate binding protein FerR (iron transport regulator)
VYTGFPHRDECDRAREFASRRLDGDLSEFDIGVLRMHLRECAECAEVAQAMERVTHRIRRSARLQPGPARPVVVSAARPSRRSGRRLLATAAAVAATAAAAGAGAIVASHDPHAATRPAHTTTLAELAPLDHQFRSIREGKLLLVLPPPRVRSPHRRGIFV